MKTLEERPRYTRDLETAMTYTLYKNKINQQKRPDNVMLPGNTQFDIRDKDSPLLNEEAKVFFHTKTAQLLYLSNASG